MAYLKELHPPMCDGCRRSKARYALYNRYNAECGSYCSACARIKLRELSFVERTTPSKK